MAGLDKDSVLRRKAARVGPRDAVGGPGADRSWRVVLARAARDAMALGIEVTQLDQSRVSLAELLDMPTDHALIAVLEGPKDGLGLMAISAPLLAAMTEMQTIGRVAGLLPTSRKPTRTDAAMTAGFIDMALCGLEAALADEADLVWAGGFRYASFLEDPRPLGLLLEDFSYRALVADVSIEGGARLGQILLALPADGRGQRPRLALPVSPDVAVGHAFAADLAAQVEGVNCVLHAVIHRLKCPLSMVLGMQVGDVLALPVATVDRVTFEGLDGLRLSDGRLGQNKGMRAIRLTPPAQQPLQTAQTNVDIIDLQRVAAAG